MFDDLTQVSALASCFIRGFMEQLPDNGTPVLNKDAQIKAKEYVESLEGSISQPYVSKLFKLIEANQLFNYGPSQGKKRTVMLSDRGSEFKQFLVEDMDFGTSVTQQMGIDELVIRSNMIDYVKDHLGVVIDSRVPVPRPAFKYLIEKFKKGDFHVAYIPDGYDVFVRKTGTKERPIKLTEFPGNSVGDE